jgi:pyrroline-5-carboxylate reductase
MNVKELRPVIIGGGNLGGAVARGLFRAGVRPVVVQHQGPNFDGLVRDGIETHLTLEEALPSASGPVFIALKPWLVADYLSEKNALLKGRIMVSCAALIELTQLEKAVPEAHWGRIMPNIASAVGAGFTGIAAGTWTADETETIRQLCALFGDAVLVTEKDLDGVICLSGSAIAYVFELLEGFIQGGLAVGMKGDVSLRAGIATLMGAAKLVKERGVHPAVLKDAVCTPGGTTIEGCRVLQKEGFKSAFIEALIATSEKSKAGTRASKAAAK